MQGSSRIPLLGEVGSIPFHSSLGTSPYHQSEVQPPFINLDDYDNGTFDFEVELNLDQFQDIATSANNFIGHECSADIDFSDFFQEAPSGGIVVRDGSLFDWCEQLNATPVSLTDDALNITSFNESNNQHFNSSPPPHENHFNMSLYDNTSEIDVVSMDSEPVQNLKSISQDRKLDFLSRTRVELTPQGGHEVGQRRRIVKKYQSPDEDYEVGDDEDDDDDDYESWSRGRKKRCKAVSKRKRSCQWEDGGYDFELKKRSQNKKAAMKYRDKKKKEDVENEGMLERLRGRNADLKRQRQEKEHELQVLRRLFDNLTKK